MRYRAPMNELLKEKVLKHMEVAISRLERGWTQGASARDTDGNLCYPTSPRAVSWCVLGAAFSSSEDVLQAIYSCLHEVLEGRGFYGSIIEWNDMLERTQKEVIQLYCEAMLCP